MIKNQVKMIGIYCMVIFGILLGCIATQAETYTSGNYTYSVSNGTACITDFPQDYQGGISIPSTLGGYPVTEIGSFAFENCTGLTSVTIPDGVTEIGVYAFAQCTSLTSIFIPNGVWNLDSYSFRGCTALTNIDLPNSVTYIGNDTFEGCSSLEQLHIPDGVKQIEKCTFRSCTMLKSVNIPNGVTYIDYFAFDGCKSLTNIEIPDSVKSIYHWAFRDCSKLSSVKLSKNWGYCEGEAFKGCVSLTKISFPEGMREIPSKAFDSCTSLKEIYIPNSVETIGAYAFKYCSIESVYIPNSVKYIYSEAFYACKALTSVYIPNSVTSIGSYAFHYTSLRSIDIPNSVTFIGEAAFSYTGLKSLVIPKSIKQMDRTAFGYCDSLEQVYISDGVTTIGESAFYECDNLTSVWIPNSVTSIGPKAFSRCWGLKSIDIPDSVTSIGYETFAWCSGLTSVDIPDSVTSIDSYAFKYCTNLTNVKLPKNWNYSGLYVFENCSSLTSISIPEGITVIPSNAFYGCTSLKQVYIPNSVTKIGANAFYGCTSLTLVQYDGTRAQWLTVEGTEYVPEGVAVHYDSKAPQTANKNIKEKTTNQMVITVYENKKDASSVFDQYVLSNGAVVTCDNAVVTTNEKGLATIPYTENSIVTVTKERFVNQTVTAEMLKQSQSVYLQKDTAGEPIIRGLYIGNTDVLTHAYEINITSKETVQMTADVEWKSGEYKEIYLLQASKRAVFNGNTLSVVLSDYFNVSEPIYIVAADTEGHASKKKLSIKDYDAYGLLGKYKINLGTEFSGTLPENIPVIGGSEIGIDWPSGIPITVTFDGSKFYGVVGLDVAKYSNTTNATQNINGAYTSKWEKTTKYLFDNIKNNWSDSKDNFNIGKLKTEWKKGLYNYSTKFGFDADLTVLGYVEGYVTNEKKVVFLDGGIVVNPSLQVGIGSQIWLTPPIYWEAAVKGEIEAMLNLYMNDTAKNFMPRGSIGGKVTLSGGVGLGVSNAIGISGGVKGSLGVSYDMYEGKDNNYFAFTGAIGAYAKAFIGPLQLFDQTWNFAEGVIYEHPSAKSLMTAPLTTEWLLDESNYTLIDRGYTAYPSEFSANDAEKQLMEAVPQNKVEKIFKSNVYTYSDPQLAVFADGTKIALWLDDNMERDAINRTSVYWSYYDGSAWTEPCELEADGTADYMPDIAVIGNMAYVVWVDTNVVLEETTDLTQIADGWDISGAVFSDGKFTDSIKITDASALDYYPRIFGDETDGMVYAVWVHNTQNDVFGKTADNTVMLSSFQNNVWNTPQAYATGLYGIDSLAGTAINGDVYIAYANRVSAELENSDNVEIFLNRVNLTNNQTPDSNVVFCDDCLYWYSNGNLFAYDFIEQSEPKAILKETIENDRFDIISNGVDKAIVFTLHDEFICELYACIYDSESGKWSNKTALTQMQSALDAFEGVYSSNGEMQFIVNKTAVDATNDTNPYGLTDLVLFSVSASCDLSIDNAYVFKEELLPGNTVFIDVEIENKGELSVHKYVVDIYDTAGAYLGSTYSEKSILPGEKQNFSVYYTLAENFSPHDIVLKLVPIVCSDYDKTDNECVVSLNWVDISVENVGYGISSDGSAVIYGSVINRGYSKESNIIVSLRESASDGNVLAFYTIPQELASFDVGEFYFDVPYEKEKIYYVTIDNEDMSLGNNADFVVMEADEPRVVVTNPYNQWIEAEAEFTDDSISVTIMPKEEHDMTTLGDCQGYMATYDEQGRLQNVRIFSSELVDHQLKFLFDLQEENMGKENKIMIWNENLNYVLVEPIIW